LFIYLFIDGREYHKSHGDQIDRLPSDPRDRGNEKVIGVTVNTMYWSMLGMQFIKTGVETSFCDLQMAKHLYLVCLFSTQGPNG